MKYFNLYIEFQPSFESYRDITTVMGVEPREITDALEQPGKEPSLWWLQIAQQDGTHADPLDEILTLVETKMDDLRALGINGDSMLIWIVYEYYRQCALGLTATEMARMGSLGINLNIDCHLVAEEV